MSAPAVGSGPSLKRRWQRFALRTQGRLDGETADRVLPWVLGFLAFVLFVALEAAAIRSLEGGSGLGPWLQAAWRRGHGGAGTPIGGVDPASGALSLIAEPILWICRFVPSEAVFTLVQAAALAAGIVPLWRLARDEADLRVGATSVVIAAYLLAPTLQRTNLSSFHPEVIALPALLGAYLNGRRERWWYFGGLVALVLASRADLGLTVAGLGILMMFLGHRAQGAIAAATGLFWSIVAVVLTGPNLPSGALTPSGEFVARATTPLAVLPKLFLDPITQLRQLVSEPSIGFLVVVLSPLLFLPLVAPRKFSGAVPCLALAMIADAKVQGAAQRGVVNFTPAAAHVAPAMAFVFVALVFALERIGERSVTRVNVDRRVLIALFVGAALLFVTESPTSPYRSPWRWGSQDATDGARLAAVDHIADHDAVAVSPGSVALVAERAEVIELPLDPVDLEPAVIRRITTRADVVLIDTNGTDPLTGRPYWPEPQQTRVLDAFAEAGLTPTYAAQGVILLTKDQEGSG